MAVFNKSEAPDRIARSLRTLRDYETRPSYREEYDALLQIFDHEGFGGRENNIDMDSQIDDLLTERLDWLRSMREEGLR